MQNGLAFSHFKKHFSQPLARTYTRCSHAARPKPILPSISSAWMSKYFSFYISISARFTFVDEICWKVHRITENFTRIRPFSTCNRNLQCNLFKIIPRKECEGVAYVYWLWKCILHSVLLCITKYLCKQFIESKEWMWWTYSNSFFLFCFCFVWAFNFPLMRVEYHTFFIFFGIYRKWMAFYRCPEFATVADFSTPTPTEPQADQKRPRMYSNIGFVGVVRMGLLWSSEPLRPNRAKFLIFLIRTLTIFRFGSGSKLRTLVGAIGMSVQVHGATFDPNKFHSICVAVEKFDCNR